MFTNWLAATAANQFPARCHYCLRPLPSFAADAADLPKASLIPTKASLVPTKQLRLLVSGGIIPLLSLPKLEFACTDAGDDAAVDEQIGSGNETCMLAQQKGCGLGYLVAGTCTLGCFLIFTFPLKQVEKRWKKGG